MRLEEALLGIAEAQRAEAAAIGRQQVAALERRGALEKVAAGFQMAAALAPQGQLREDLRTRASLYAREARTVGAEAGVFDAERKRVLKEADSNERRAQIAR